MPNPKNKKPVAPATKKLTAEELEARSQEGYRLKENAEKLMAEAGMDIRKLVLYASLLFEEHIGSMLMALLQVKKPENVGLSFNQKIEFLEAVDVIDHDGKKALMAFKFVRNKFVHEIQVNSFTKCFEKNSDAKTIVLELAETAILELPDEYAYSEEERLRFGFNLLTQKMAEITGKVLQETKARVSRIAHGPMYERTFTHIKDNIYEPIDAIAQAIRGDAKESYSKEDVEAIVADIRSSIKSTIRTAAHEGLKLGQDPTGVPK